MGMIEYITDSGFDLLNRMLSGESKIQFTRVEMGDGYPSELNYKKVKSLAKPIVSLDVESVHVSENKTVRITAIFNNTELTEGFYYREKGIYATDGEKEILFSYANAREDAGFIDPPTVCMVEKKIISYMTQLQGTDGEVKIDVKSGIYVSTDDFVYYMSTSIPEYSVPEYDELKEYAFADKDNMSTILGKSCYLLERFIEHVLDFKNPHKVSKEDVNLGNVPNVSTNDQTPTFTVASSRANISTGEKLSIILGKISKWFSDLKMVAFSGSYVDLTDKPTIPTAVRVKGNKETQYRTGDVNITPANVGALSEDGTAKKALADGDGNVIKDTYVNKNEVTVKIGKDATTSSNHAVALGSSATALKYYSVSLGYNSNAPEDYSTALGSSATASGVCSTALGSNATASGSFSTALGRGANISQSDEHTIQLGASTLSNLRCRVALSVTSDIRDKTDINNITNATEFLNKINPFTYVSNARDLYSKEKLTDEEEENYKKYGFKPYDKAAHEQGIKKGERRRMGVSAQEVQEALTKVYGSADYANLVNDNLHDVNPSEIPEGVESHLTVTYESFIPFLIKAVQELSEENQKLKQRLDKLEM